jgi:hypothetical protein
MMRVIAIASALAVLSAAQVSDSGWDVLTQSAGQRVEIVRKDGLRVKGKVDGASARDLTVGGRRFLKEQVSEVYALDRGSRWKGVAIGAAIGFGAGFAWLAAMKAGNGDWSWSDGFELFGPIGAAGGAPIGLALGGHRKRAIYRAP